MARPGALFLLFLALMTAAPAVTIAADTPCRELSVDFIVLEGEATLAALEDDIGADLVALGITVNRRFLPKEAFNTAMTSGDFNMAFSETWGPPYDPHSYAKSWSADEAHHTAHKGLPPPVTRDVLDGMVDKLLTVEDEEERRDGWAEVLTVVHKQAVNLPFSGKRIPAVISRRLSNFRPGYQQFDYPLHTLRVESGSTTITVSPGARFQCAVLPRSLIPLSPPPC